MSAAKEHFEGYDDALERYKKHLPDPFKNRIKQYREGAWFGVSSKDCGDAVFGKWVSYYKVECILLHTRRATTMV